MDNIKRLVATLMATISNCSLYSKDHASVDELIKRSLSILNELFTKNESVEIMFIENDLVINKLSIKDKGIHETNLLKRFKRKGMSMVVFLKGLTSAELREFIADISLQSREIRSYSHIKTGTVGVNIDFKRIIEDKADIDLENEDTIKLSSEQVMKMKEVYLGLSPYKKLKTTVLEDIVANFIFAFKKKINILNLISSVRDGDEHTYVHATNVAALSMLQAESFGLMDELLYDIGIASLLHDVGKLFISRDILEKSGDLSEDEWEEIKRHTLYGARYLLKVNGLTRLAPIVAFEHHMRYDGEGYPVLGDKNKRQHICSQIVAISDFYDLIKNSRPYSERWQIEEILMVMNEKAGTEFNPLLLNNFTKLIINALDGISPK